MLRSPIHDNDPPYQQSRIGISRYAARYAMLRKNDGPNAWWPDEIEWCNEIHVLHAAGELDYDLW